MVAIGGSGGLHCMLEPAECCLARVLSGGEFPSHKLLNSIGIPLWDVDCIIHVLESTSLISGLIPLPVPLREHNELYTHFVIITYACE